MNPIKVVQRVLEEIYNQSEQTIKDYRIQRYLATGIDDRFLGYDEHPKNLI